MVDFMVFFCFIGLMNCLLRFWMVVLNLLVLGIWEKCGNGMYYVFLYEIVWKKFWNIKFIEVKGSKMDFLKFYFCGEIIWFVV